MLNVGLARKGAWTVLRVSGEIDMATAPDLRQVMVKLISEGQIQLVVDLDAVEFIDSTGLGVLIGGLRRARSHGGDLRVAGIGGRIEKVFDLTGLGDVLVIVDADSPEDPLVSITQ